MCVRVRARNRSIVDENVAILYVVEKSLFCSLSFSVLLKPQEEKNGDRIWIFNCKYILLSERMFFVLLQLSCILNFSKPTSITAKTHARTYNSSLQVFTFSIK